MVTAAASTAFRGIKFYLLGFSIILLAIIFLQSITQSIQQKSFEPFVREVGQRFILASKSLDVESKAVVANKGILPVSGGGIKGLWASLLSCAALLGALIVVYEWLKVLSWFWEKTPYSLNPFTHYSLAFLSFWIIQIIALLINASMSNQVLTFTGENSVTEMLLQPVKCFWSFLKAVPYLISPASEIVRKIEKVA